MTIHRTFTIACDGFAGDGAGCPSFTARFGHPGNTSRQVVDGAEADGWSKVSIKRAGWWQVVHLCPTCTHERGHHT